MLAHLFVLILPLTIITSAQDFTIPREWTVSITFYVPLSEMYTETYALRIPDHLFLESRE